MKYTTAEVAQTYDEYPYGGMVVSLSHPVRLATRGKLRGLKPAKLAQAKVLELGCAEGGNLLPLAEVYPEADFVGIDISSQQIQLAEQRRDLLRLENVDLRCRDILDLGTDLGGFDYVIAHGVYSWVQPEVQRHLLDLCRSLLRPDGVAYVSYNVFPGWHLRLELRSLILSRTRHLARLADRVAMAQEILHALADAADPDDPYGQVLRSQIDISLRSGDGYLAHEYLELVNDPISHEEFVARADTQGLRYLGDLGRDLELTLRGDPSFGPDDNNPVEAQQLGDLVRNKSFRAAALCRSDAPATTRIGVDQLEGFFVAAPLAIDHLSDVFDDSEASFRSQDGAFRTDSPAVKIALEHLCSHWPASVPLAQLATVCMDRLRIAPGSPEAVATRRLVDTELLALASHGAVQLFAEPFPFVVECCERPTTSRFVRQECAFGPTVSNLRHERLQIDELMRFVLGKLDGTKSVDDLTAEAEAAAHSGDLVISTDNGAVEQSSQRLTQTLRWKIPWTVDQAARQALLLS